MNTLLLQLPTCAPGPQALYVRAWVDSAAGSKPRLHLSSCSLALLPRPKGRQEIVVMVPLAALSWQRVSLPAGLPRSGPRLHAALVGLLEDRLLQDPSQVQLALPPRWSAAQPCWVAVCDKAWLHAHLQALDEAGLPVQRVVPELAPPEQGRLWYALANQQSQTAPAASLPTGNAAAAGSDGFAAAPTAASDAAGWLWCCSAEAGVSGHPIEAALPWPELDGGERVRAEAALASWAQTRLSAPPQLVDNASHWHEALAGDWNLAQFDLQTKLRAPGWHRLRRRLDAVLRQPQWRPARWGLLALLVAQVLGLNAWAWMTRQQWQAQQAQWGSMLQQSFAHVTVVVDAPLQMAREVERLRREQGELAASDLEAMLHALGSALPPQASSPSQLNYQDQTLQWPELNLSEPQQTAFEQALQRQGYRLQVQERLWRLQAQGQR